MSGFRLAAVTGMIVLLALAGTSTVAQPDGDDLTVLAEYMTGSFSSAAQAAEDSSYFDIRLEMSRIPSEDGEIWIYVEQATADQLGTKPYRQRVYRLEDAGDGILYSHVYTLPGDPLRIAGAYDVPEALATIPLEALELLEGCSIELRRVTEMRFEGATDETACENTWGGAAYATSEVTITPDALISWDRGYNEQGEQVWGAEKGGYVFKKVRDR